MRPPARRRNPGRAGRLLLATSFPLLLAACSIERFLNRVAVEAPSDVSDRGRALHASSAVVDLHSDALLWGRDLAERSSVGHVDLPRLRDGNVALEVFAVPTRVPMSINIHRTDERWPDLITLLAVVHRWPRATLRSYRERALYRAYALEDLAASDARMILVRTRRDLSALAARRRTDRRVVGALFAIEGAQALEGDLGNLAPLYDRGLRMVGLAHFFDNEFAGSAHGRRKTGLTRKGRVLVHELERRGVVIDLAHSSAQTIQDVLAIATRPLVVSHTGVAGTCSNPRNLSDDQLRAVAAADGVVGIGFWETAVCGTSAADIVRAIRHTVDVIGDRHVALGSDFDGAVKTPFDASGIAAITQALLDAGFTEDSIRRILGGNALRLLRSALPPS